MNIEFLATVAVIASDPPASRKLYADALGLPLESEGPAAQELEQAGYELLHPQREEPWGQTVARLQSPEGAVVGISFAPVLHGQD